MLNSSTIRGNGFSLVPLLDSPAPTVELSGNGDAEAVTPLDRWLAPTVVFLNDVSAPSLMPRAQ
jgi:hypothetical protein